MILPAYFLNYANRNSQNSYAYLNASYARIRIIYRKQPKLVANERVNRYAGKVEYL